MSMLTEEQLEGLLRDAGRVEAFHGGEVPLPYAPRGSAWPRLRNGLAVAAMLMVIVGVGLLIHGPVPTGKGLAGGGGSALPVTPLTPLTPANEGASVLLAVYQDDAGGVACVNWSAGGLGGRELSNLTAEELTRKGLALRCDPSAARLLVVGMQGPPELLPSSDERARVIAQCLSATQACGARDFLPASCASAGCVGKDVKVRVASIALK